MQISDILAQTGGLECIARELGVSEAQAASGAAALTPAILGGIQKPAESQPLGLEGLGGLPGNSAVAACSTTWCHRSRPM